MRNLLARDPKGLHMVVGSDQGWLVGIYDGRFSDGLRFPNPQCHPQSSWIPNLVHHTIRGSVGIDLPTDHRVQLSEISLSTVFMCRVVSTVIVFNGVV